MAVGSRKRVMRDMEERKTIESFWSNRRDRGVALPHPSKDSVTYSHPSRNWLLVETSIIAVLEWRPFERARLCVWWKRQNGQLRRGKHSPLRISPSRNLPSITVSTPLHPLMLLTHLSHLLFSTCLDLNHPNHLPNRVPLPIPLSYTSDDRPGPKPLRLVLPLPSTTTTTMTMFMGRQYFVIKCNELISPLRPQPSTDIQHRDISLNYPR